MIALTLTAPTILAQHTALAHRGWVMGIWGGFMPFGCAFAIISCAISDRAGRLAIGMAGWALFSVLVVLLGGCLSQMILCRYDIILT